MGCQEIGRAAPPALLACLGNPGPERQGSVSGGWPPCLPHEPTRAGAPLAVGAILFCFRQRAFSCRTRGKCPSSRFEVPARHRRTFRRRRALRNPGSKQIASSIEPASVLAPSSSGFRLSPERRLCKVPTGAGTTVLARSVLPLARGPACSWFPRTGKRNDRPGGLKLGPANGFSPDFGSSDNANFLISAPFWAIPGRFVFGGAVRWHPGGPKMGRCPDRKWVGRVGHSGPFWAVLGHFPDLSQGDLLISGLSRQGST